MNQEKDQFNWLMKMKEVATAESISGDGYNQSKFNILDFSPQRSNMQSRPQKGAKSFKLQALDSKLGPGGFESILSED